MFSRKIKITVLSAVFLFCSVPFFAAAQTTTRFPKNNIGKIVKTIAVILTARI